MRHQSSSSNADTAAAPQQHDGKPMIDAALEHLEVKSSVYSDLRDQLKPSLEWYKNRCEEIKAPLKNTSLSSKPEFIAAVDAFGILLERAYMLCREVKPKVDNVNEIIAEYDQDHKETGVCHDADIWAQLLYLMMISNSGTLKQRQQAVIDQIHAVNKACKAIETNHSVFNLQFVTAMKGLAWLVGCAAATCLLGGVAALASVPATVVGGVVIGGVALNAVYTTGATILKVQHEKHVVQHVASETAKIKSKAQELKRLERDLHDTLYSGEHIMNLPPTSGFTKFNMNRARKIAARMQQSVTELEQATFSI